VDLTQLLAFAMQNNASDLHLSAGNPPMVRVYGEIKKVKSEALSGDDVRTMLYSIMSEEQRARYEKELDLDFSISFGEKTRFRVNSYNTSGGAAAVFRAIPSEIPSVDELELPHIIKKFASLDKGIVLVTGPTGSGKSTTLASMVDYINRTMNKHILTIEDPIEFFHASQKSLVNMREVGRHTMSFKSALKSALREDPDVILVGEMRDYETISLALTAAETGHLVFGTLHANTAYKTVDRIIDVFPANDKDMARTMLSSSLQAVVAQTLLKRANGSGRIAAHEILVGTPAVRNLIRENQITQIYSMLQTGSRYGMMTMDESIRNLFEQGVISQETAKRALMEVSDEEMEVQDEASSSDGKNKGTSTVESSDEEAYSF